MIEPGRLVGNYEILGSIGAGAVGAVARARHRTLGTEHAIKVLRVDDPEARRRLVAEGQAQARLEHPNLVRVTDVVEIDGRPALVMDFVPGPTLAALLGRVRLDANEARRVFDGIVAGVAAAHAARIVHRDLKPANVLIDTRTQPPRPRVTDFGIARALDRPGGTQQGRLLGTLGYLAPEQVGDAASADARADVFSLGVILVELVTGARPFKDRDVLAWLAEVRSTPWRPPADFPPELAAIATRCLAASPAARPADAGVVRAMLGHPTPVAARPARRWVLGAVAAAGAAAGWWARPDAPPPSESLTALAWRTAALDPAASLALLRAASADGALPAELTADLAARGAAVDVFPTAEAVLAADVDATRVAVAELNGRVSVWSLTDGRPIATVETGIFRPRDLELLADGSGFVLRAHDVMGRADTDTLVWALPGGEPRVRDPLHLSGQRTREAGELVLAVLGDARGATLQAWDRAGRAWARPLPGPLAGTWSTGGDVVAVPTTDCRVWSLTSGAEVAAWDCPVRPVRLELDPTGTRVVESSSQGAVLRLLDDPTHAIPLWSDVGSPDAAFAPDGARFTLTHRDRTDVEVLAADGTSLRLLTGHTRAVVGPAFLDADTLATASSDRSVRVWDAITGACQATWLGHHGQITTVASDGARIVTGALDRSARVWRLPSSDLGRWRATLPARARVRADGLTALAWSDTTLRAWRPGDKADRSYDVAGLGPLFAVAASEDGQRVLVKGRGAATTVYGAGAERVVFDSLVGPASAAIAPDGRTAAVAHRERIGLWSLPDGHLLAGGPLDGADPVLVYTPDAARLLVGLADGVEVWRVSLPALERRLTVPLTGQRGISRLVTAGDRAVAGFYGGGVIVWDLATGEAVILRDAGEDVVGLATDGDHVAVGTRDGAVTWGPIGGGAPTASTRIDGEPLRLALLDGGVAIGDSRGRAHTWRPGEAPVVRATHAGPVLVLQPLGDGRVASTSTDGESIVWDAHADTPSASVAATGGWSNLRVCRGSHEVVPVLPFPDPQTVWAPDAACLEEGR